MYNSALRTTVNLSGLPTEAICSRVYVLYKCNNLLRVDKDNPRDIAFLVNEQVLTGASG